MQGDFFPHVMLSYNKTKKASRPRSSPTNSLIKERNITVPKLKHKGGEATATVGRHFDQDLGGDFPLKDEGGALITKSGRILGTFLELCFAETFLRDLHTRIQQENRYQLQYVYMNTLI